ncbi:MAG: Ig-like domain-containing protein [Lachnospiraceae bacterium]|nr:Ig-like domain-containing protein [Lachnospiraceae bacterium]
MENKVKFLKKIVVLITIITLIFMDISKMYLFGEMEDIEQDNIKISIDVKDAKNNVISENISFKISGTEIKYTFENNKYTLFLNKNTTDGVNIDVIYEVKNVNEDNNEDKGNNGNEDNKVNEDNNEDEGNNGDEDNNKDEGNNGDEDNNEDKGNNEDEDNKVNEDNNEDKGNNGDEDNKEDKDNEYKRYEESIVYYSNKSEYDVIFGEYVNLNNDDGEFNDIGDTYTVSKNYSSSSSDLECVYTINSDTTGIKYEIVDDKTTAEIDNISEDGTIHYASPGIIVVKCSSDDNFIKDTTFILELKNNLRFEFSKNKDNETVDEVHPNEILDNEIETVAYVTKTISSKNEKVHLTLSCEYEDDKIIYSTSDENIATVNAKGYVTIISSGMVTITASSSLTNETASYELQISATTPVINLNYIDKNSINNAKEESINIEGDSNIVTLDYASWENKTFTVEGTTAYYNCYDISYESKDESVAEVSNTGAVTVKGAGKTEITVTATPKDDWSGIFTSTTKTYTLIIKSDVKICIDSYNEILLISDESIKCDASGNEISLKLPLNIEVKDDTGKTLMVKDDTGKTLMVKDDTGKTVDMDIKLESGELSFTDFTINNPDKIIRNKDFTVKIIFEGTDCYKYSYKEITVRVKGSITNNDNDKYYKISGLKNGLDGNKWKIEGEDVIIKSSRDDIFISLDKEDPEGRKEEIVYETDFLRPAGTELKIYIFDDPSWINCHEYFGVDNTNPEIKEVTTDEKTVTETSYGQFSREDIIVTVKAYDKENNLYDILVYEYVNGEKIELDLSDFSLVKTGDGHGTYTFKLEKENGRRLFSDVEIVVRDAAGNESLKEKLGNFLIEEDEPKVKISVTNDYGNNKYPEDDEDDENHIIYVSGDVEFTVKVSDFIENIIPIDEEAVISGIKSYKVSVNNSEIYIKEISSSEKIITDTACKINTSAYNHDNGKLEIKVFDIYDNSGNKCDDYPLTVYFDNSAPDITYIGSNITGSTEKYGNFYDRNLEYKFSVKDTSIGAKSYALIVGNTQYPEKSIENGEINVSLKLGTKGNVSIKVKDYLGNEKTYKLNEIKDKNGNIEFSSNYVVVENLPVNVKIKPNREPDKGNWYNHGINVNITATEIGSISSGIKSVEIYVNDKLYKKQEYNNAVTTNEIYNISITDEDILELINSTGLYTVKAVVIDNAGNKEVHNEVYNESFYIDNVAPVISNLTGVEDGSNNTGIVTVNVEVFEKHYNEAGYDTKVNVIREADGVREKYDVEAFEGYNELSRKSYVFSEDGKYTIEVISEDAAGNKAEAKTISFTLDNMAPIVNISGIVENGFYKDSANISIDIIESNYRDMDIVIAIEKELNGVVTNITNDELSIDNKQGTIVQTFMEEGTYTITVDAVDVAGNTAITRTVIFTVDTNAPKIVIAGVENGGAYKGEVLPQITISDNYYSTYDIKLIKTGVYFNGSKINIDNVKDIDVTDIFIGNIYPDKTSVNAYFDSFEEIQENDGIYTLIVTAEDMAGRVTTQSIKFSVNRFGSVYTFDNNLINILNTYNQSVNTDFVITEYNADKLIEDSVIIRIFRDGTPIQNIDIEATPQNSSIRTGESGWYQYTYRISSDNFKYDGVYMITVSSKDEAGNNSETITYDDLIIRFCVDTTKPQVVKVIGLEDYMYNADKIEVRYEIFDAVALKELRIYVAGEVVERVTDFKDVTSYEGVFVLNEGVEQSIRFEVEDMAGNIVNSDNEEDIKSGNIAAFSKSVTISTNFFIRWYSNRIVFCISIVGLIAIIGIIILFIYKKIKK